MLVMVLSVLAFVFTILRSWPQAVRIVVRHERAGVSALTWMMALANHTGWFVFGLLSGVPLLVVVNLLAAAGCAVTVLVLRSWTPVVALAGGSVAVALVTFAVSGALLLGIVTAAALTMFVPQLVRTLRRPAAGVSPAAWAMSSLASMSWLTYAWVIDRPSIVIAHLFMLPASLVIVGRSLTALVGDQAPPLGPPAW